jgi:hypothetical protein
MEDLFLTREEAEKALGKQQWLHTS